jgi:hypothetical protein
MDAWVYAWMQAGNWIQRTSDGGERADLVIIDYEYSRYDFRGFDLGNLACEFTFSYAVSDPPGYTFDATAYPSSEQLGSFFEAYAEGFAPERASRPTPSELASEMDSGILASHLYWTLWSILMGAGQLGIPWGPEVVVASGSVRAESPAGPSGAVSDSPVAAGHSIFDYIHYGFTRAREYLRLKDK